MTTPEEMARFTRMEKLFHEALNQPEDEREVWLRGECGDDAALLQSTLGLLRAYRREQDASQTLQGSLTRHSVAGKRLGPYEILSLLGRGGMGAVYLAQRADGQYEKKVAIKLVDLPLATEIFFERFRQERQILAGLDHPGIARMLDGGVSEDGILYLVLEYVDGEPIDIYVRTHSVSLDSKLKLFVKVCRAVQFAHQNLVIHRDLKPDNILVSADGEPHLLDFGTAKLLSADRTADVQGLTRHGFLSFTPAYASPEQVLGKLITTATDTYSLGVLLYLLLTGRLPYELSEFTTDEMVDVICEQPRYGEFIAPSELYCLITHRTFACHYRPMLQIGLNIHCKLLCRAVSLLRLFPQCSARLAASACRNTAKTPTSNISNSTPANAACRGAVGGFVATER